MPRWKTSASSSLTRNRSAPISPSPPRGSARRRWHGCAAGHGARLLLCSATPSVESYHAARTGRYTLARLTERYSGQLPDVTIVDTTRTERVGRSSQEPLCAELLKNLEMGEQSILLLNRRGYHTVMKCSSCGEAVTCPNCSVAMTYHRQNGRLMCHYCGHTQEVPGGLSPLRQFAGAVQRRGHPEG
ncbi:MAG: hypothetical protein V8Q30_02205 [Acutalibacteraceae bacterium]